MKLKFTAHDTGEQEGDGLNDAQHEKQIGGRVDAAKEYPVEGNTGPGP
jgi:hypothetical protein